MLSVSMRSVSFLNVMLSVVMPGVVMLSAILPTVIAPKSHLSQSSMELTLAREAYLSFYCLKNGRHDTLYNSIQHIQ